MRLPLCLIALALATPAAAQTPAAPAPAAEPVVVIVDIAAPPGLAEDRIRAAMAQLAPQYRAVPGLIRKYFTLSTGHFGGVYYWRDRAAAEAWFNASWQDRVKQSYGSAADLRYYAVPIVVDGERP